MPRQAADAIHGGKSPCQYAWGFEVKLQNNMPVLCVCSTLQF